ncbi:hypothetical protein QMS71_07815 [Cronobacter sakazakii]|uniref:Uncharacterized protein n=5 Tax=Cronobacter TaxID=413496 RepID=A0AAN6AV07_CROSK|nr:MULTISPECIES: hypothetical protein [Cronobacter]EKY3193793.1 hypothetical protein [Cronobacter turicensis]AFJ98430.1 hypothetical protein ES15_0857 [Cronobacter sakazakii ES15]AHB69266.1 hypothetical protein P262_01270 [Cronobacter malonaticus]AXW94621.1 hypothetical protein CsakCS931_10630 [Cronobacter sakazakii]EGT4275464.1 hypothetical protein [Cronobacter sakazakii]
MLWIGFLAGFVFATLLFTVFAFTSSSNRLKKGFSNFKTELRIILFARTTVALEAAARNFQLRLQKIIFLTLTLVLCVKGGLELLQTFGVFPQDKASLYSFDEAIYFIIHFSTLKYVASALAISCGIQLAYMLVTEGPDEAVEPIMLGVASGILLILSDANATEWDADRSVAVFLLIVSIPVLYASSRWMNKNREEEKKQRQERRINNKKET